MMSRDQSTILNCLRQVVFVLAGAALIPSLVGCTATHAERRVEAEQRWEGVRSRIKLQMAQQQYEQGMVDEAVTLIEEALGWEPENGDAHLLIARCYLEQDKVAAAHRAVELAADLCEDTAELSFVRGMVAERMGQYDKAALFYRHARMIDDAVVEYLMSEAECMVMLGKPYDAQALLVSRVVDYGNDPGIHALLGEIALHVGNHAQALESFRIVLDSGSFDPVIAEECALLMARFNHYGEALAILNRLVGQYPGLVSGSVERTIAACLIALGRTEEAKGKLTVITTKNPGDAEAWYMLAQAGIVTGDLPTVRRALVAVSRLAPRRSETTLIGAYVDLQLGRVKQAERRLHHLLTENENDAFIYCLLGTAAEREQEWEIASKHYRRALEIDEQCDWARAALSSTRFRNVKSHKNAPSYDNLPPRG